MSARVTVDAITLIKKCPEYNATVDKKSQMPESGVGVRAGHNYGIASTNMSIDKIEPVTEKFKTIV